MAKVINLRYLKSDNAFNRLQGIIGNRLRRSAHYTGIYLEAKKYLRDNPNFDVKSLLDMDLSKLTDTQEFKLAGEQGQRFSIENVLAELTNPSTGTQNSKGTFNELDFLGGQDPKEILARAGNQSGPSQPATIFSGKSQLEYLTEQGRTQFNSSNPLGTAAQASNRTGSTSSGGTTSSPSRGILSGGPASIPAPSGISQPSNTTPSNTTPSNNTPIPQAPDAVFQNALRDRVNTFRRASRSGKRGTFSGLNLQAIRRPTLLGA